MKGNANQVALFSEMKLASKVKTLLKVTLQAMAVQLAAVL